MIELKNKMHIEVRAYFWGFILLIALFSAAGCANRVSPNGGPKDTVAPKLLKTIPENGTLNFTGNKVVLTFDEFVKPATYGREIFISPLLTEKPAVLLSSKKIVIHFREKLKDSTTYVINISDITDFYGGNKMGGNLTLAFSTGNQLDSMQVAGKVESPVVGKGEEGITLLLFHPDSIQDHDFFGKQPSYIGKSDELGNFEMSYLRDQPYKIFGVKDADQSNTYSQPTEMIAIPDSALLTFPDTGLVARTDLFSFIPDQTAPQIRKYDWLNDSTLLLSISENLRFDSLQIQLKDTNGNDLERLTKYTRLIQKEPLLVLPWPKNSDRSAILSLQHLSDSLGNRSDTLLAIRDKRSAKPPKAPLVTEPLADIASGSIRWILPFPAVEADTFWIALKDTGGREIPIRFMPNVFSLELIPLEKLDPALPYMLELGGIKFGLPDTNFTYPVIWPDKEKYGSLEGKLAVKDYDGPVVLILEGAKGGKRYTSYGRKYNFPLMEEGNYKITIILDEDGNQCWTPGSLQPYRFPERIVKPAEMLAIRASWALEAYEIITDKKGTGALPDKSPETPGASPGKKPGGKGTGRPGKG